jgi:hypothetical protein
MEGYNTITAEKKKFLHALKLFEQALLSHLILPSSSDYCAPS